MTRVSAWAHLCQRVWRIRVFLQDLWERERIKGGERLNWGDEPMSPLGASTRGGQSTRCHSCRPLSAPKDSCQCVSCSALCYPEPTGILARDGGAEYCQRGADFEHLGREMMRGGRSLEQTGHHPQDFPGLFPPDRDRHEQKVRAFPLIPVLKGERCRIIWKASPACFLSRKKRR